MRVIPYASLCSWYIFPWIVHTDGIIYTYIKTLAWIQYKEKHKTHYLLCTMSEWAPQAAERFYSCFHRRLGRFKVPHSKPLGFQWDVTRCMNLYDTVSFGYFHSIFTRSIAPQFFGMILVCALFPCEHGPKEIFKGSLSRSPARGGRGRGARVWRKRRALLWTLAIQLICKVIWGMYVLKPCSLVIERETM